MEKVLENPDLVGWTPDDVVKLGKEWIDSKVVEFSRQEGISSILLLQLESDLIGRS